MTVDADAAMFLGSRVSALEVFPADEQSMDRGGPAPTAWPTAKRGRRKATVGNSSWNMRRRARSSPSSLSRRYRFTPMKFGVLPVRPPGSGGKDFGEPGPSTGHAGSRWQQPLSTGPVWLTVLLNSEAQPVLPGMGHDTPQEPASTVCSARCSLSAMGIMLVVQTGTNFPVAEIGDGASSGQCPGASCRNND